MMIKKMRSSNIELCRIASILLVILLHSAVWTQGDVSTWETCYVPSLFMRGFAVIGVNVFVFISGWFGISFKKKSLFNLLYICVFYGILRVASLYLLGDLKFRNLFLISDTNWFVISYIGLLLFSPILNKYIETATQKQLGTTVLLLIVFQTWFGCFPALPLFDTFQNGYYFASFIVIYLIAQYLRHYGAPNWIEKYCLPVYLFISVGLGLTALFAVRFGVSVTGYIYKYNNPLVILSAVCFFYIFKGIKMPNSKAVNYIATSTLAVLLIHEPQPFHRYMKLSFSYLRDNGGGLVLYWIIAVISVYVFCVALDQFRIISYKLINKFLFNKNG